MIKYFGVGQDFFGMALPGVPVTVLDSLTGSFAPLFEDDGVTPKSNPTTTSSSGMYSFAIAAGVYDITVFSTAPMIKVNIIEDPSIIYRVNSGAPLIYGDSVYSSGDGTVALAGTTGTAEQARVLAICVETTLATGATGRFRHFGMVTHTGTPGALGYLGQDGLPTEVVPYFEDGDKFSTILGRQFSNTQFHVRGVSGDGKGGGVGVSLELSAGGVRPSIIGWSGSLHGISWGTSDSTYWTDGNLQFVYDHPAGIGEAYITIQAQENLNGAGFFGNLGVSLKVTTPSGEIAVGSSFTTSGAGLYTIRPFVDIRVLPSYGYPNPPTHPTHFLGLALFMISVNGVPSTVSVTRRGQIRTGYTYAHFIPVNTSISPPLLYLGVEHEFGVDGLPFTIVPPSYYQGDHLVSVFTGGANASLTGSYDGGYYASNGTARSGIRWTKPQGGYYEVVGEIDLSTT